MSYTVAWTQSSLDELAELWQLADRRSEITDAIHQIDQLLSARPTRLAMPLSEGLFVLIVFPIRVIFEVREADLIVEVLRIKKM